MNLSSPKSYLPMLTGLMLGEAMSCHDGVSCYPALRHSNQEKYILKVISVPASKVQMDAMLLTGAFPTREAALEYYLDISRDVLREAEILRQLSQQEGFIPNLDAQIVDKDSGNGYDVYLLNNFRYSLAQIFEAEVLTHKQIMRMSLDLCAALVACRREGYLYVDLKPANIFFSEEQGYRIGDVGFASLASLPYSSLPEKYRSPYTAP
jgi:serine/threonine protein kinase